MAPPAPAQMDGAFFKVEYGGRMKPAARKRGSGQYTPTRNAYLPPHFPPRRSAPPNPTPLPPLENPLFCASLDSGSQAVRVVLL